MDSFHRNLLAINKLEGAVKANKHDPNIYLALIKSLRSELIALLTNWKSRTININKKRGDATFSKLADTTNSSSSTNTCVATIATQLTHLASLAHRLYESYRDLSRLFPLVMAFNPLILAQWEDDYHKLVLAAAREGRRLSEHGLNVEGEKNMGVEEAEENEEEEEQFTVNLFAKASSESNCVSRVRKPVLSLVSQLESLEPPLFAISPITLLGLSAHACAGGLASPKGPTQDSLNNTKETGVPNGDPSHPPPRRPLTAALAAVLYNNALSLWIHVVGPEPDMTLSTNGVERDYIKNDPARCQLYRVPQYVRLDEAFLRRTDNDGEKDEEGRNMTTKRYGRVDPSECASACPYRVSLDLSDGSRVRETAKRISALVSLLGSSGAVEAFTALVSTHTSNNPPLVSISTSLSDEASSNNTDTAKMPSLTLAHPSLWFDIHRALLELGDEDFCKDPSTDEEKEGRKGKKVNVDEDGDGATDSGEGSNSDENKEEEGTGKNIQQPPPAETLTKRSFIASLRAPFEEESLVGNIISAFNDMGDKRSEKIAVSLTSRSDRKKLLELRKGFIDAFKRLAASVVVRVSVKSTKISASSNNSDTSELATIAKNHKLFSAAALAYAWDLARLVDGLAAHCFLLHTMLTLLCLYGFRNGSVQHEEVEKASEGNVGEEENSNKPASATRTPSSAGVVLTKNRLFFDAAFFNVNTFESFIEIEEASSSSSLSSRYVSSASLFPIAIDKHVADFIRGSGHSSLVKYATRALAFGQKVSALATSSSSSSSNANSIGVASSLCDVGACMDIQTVVAPVFFGIADLLRVLGGRAAAGSNSGGGGVVVGDDACFTHVYIVEDTIMMHEHDKAEITVAQSAVGEKRTREEKEGVRKADCGKEHTSNDDDERNKKIRCETDAKPAATVGVTEEGNEEETEEKYEEEGDYEEDPRSCILSPPLSEPALVAKIVDMCLALLQVMAESTIIGHDVRKSVKTARKTVTLLVDVLYMRFLPLLLLEAEEKKSNPCVEDADVKWTQPAIGFLADDEAENPNSRLDRVIASLRIHLVVKKTLYPFILQNQRYLEASNSSLETVKKEQDEKKSGAVSKAIDQFISSFVDHNTPVALSAHAVRLFCQSVEETTAAIAIEGYENFSPHEMADAAFLILNRLRVVADLVMPTLIEGQHAHMISDLFAAIDSASPRWEGILRKLKTLKKADKKSNNKNQRGDDDDAEDHPIRQQCREEQHAALLRRAIAKAEEVVSALLDFRINQMLVGGEHFAALTSASASSYFSTPIEAAYLFSALGKLGN